MQKSGRRYSRLLAMLLVFLLVFPFCGTALAYNMPYYIQVDLTNQIVTIYRSQDKSIAYQMLCSTGKAMPTPTGTYYLPKTNRSDMRSENYYYFQFYDSYAKWATRIEGGYLFHSVCYAKQDDSTIALSNVKQFGNPASHGCIRLRPDDAKFIAQNCLAGTMTKIIRSKQPNAELRRLLYYRSYTGDMSYERFCGTASEENELGLGSTGSKVSDLQARLKDLGYLNGSVTGTYDTDTVIAVKHLQYRLGLTMDGVYNTDLDKVLFSKDMPLSTDTTLSPGSIGLAVRRLQNTLTTMGLYTGAIDEIYSDALAEAVRKFQHVNFFNEDGIATPEIQAAIYYHEARMLETFGDLEGITAEAKSETIRVGVLKAQNGRKLHKSPSLESKSVGTVSSGETVLVAGIKNSWAAVWTGEAGGYLLKANLKITERDNTVAIYSKPGSSATYQMGYTMAEFNTGKKSFAISFDKLYTLQQFFYGDTEAHRTVMVNTGEDDVTLNLRAEPDGSAEVLEAVPNREKLTAHSVGDEFTMVTYNGKVGFLLNDYLTFDALEEEELDDDIRTEEEKAEAETAKTLVTVVSTDGKNAVAVYDENAKQIGTLPVGTQVELIQASEDYDAALIRYQGHEGYMYLDNLSGGDDAEEETADDAGAEAAEESSDADGIEITDEDFDDDGGIDLTIPASAEEPAA